MNKLNYSEIYDMSLDELIENKNSLPSEVDVENLTNENFFQFKEVVSYLKECEEENTESNKAISEFNKNYAIGHVAGYGSIPVIVGLHELIHAAGAKIGGGKIHEINLSISKEGLEGYVQASMPNEIASMFAQILPNFALPLFGFYCIKKGEEKRDFIPIGFGLSALALHTNSFMSPGGDFYEVARTLNEALPIESSNTANMIMGGGLLALNYAAAYEISTKIDSIKNYISDIYKKIKR